SVDPHATGEALIEMRGGALVLSRVILHHDLDSRLEHLLSVEDAHLVLSQCRLTVPEQSGHERRGLIAFRGRLTKPMEIDALQPLFNPSLDRPVCYLIDSTLISDGTALTAELGRGLISISQCALAAAGPVLELVPSLVARRRFEV